MARPEPVAPVKLAFLVEGDADKAFIEALVPRILGPRVGVRVVRVGGKAAFASTFFEAAQFLEAGYAQVFLLLDADTEIREEIELQKRQLMEIFRRYGLKDHVQIYMAVPMLEAWLLAAYRGTSGAKHASQARPRSVCRCGRQQQDRSARRRASDRRRPASLQEL